MEVIDLRVIFLQWLAPRASLLQVTICVCGLSATITDQKLPMRCHESMLLNSHVCDYH